MGIIAASCYIVSNLNSTRDSTIPLSKIKYSQITKSEERLEERRVWCTTSDVLCKIQFTNPRPLTTEVVPPHWTSTEEQTISHFSKLHEVFHKFLSDSYLSTYPRSMVIDTNILQR